MRPRSKGFESSLVPCKEGYAANTLAIGDYVIVPAGFVKTEQQLRAFGFSVLPVPMSEFHKAGRRCVLPEPGHEYIIFPMIENYTYSSIHSLSQLIRGTKNRAPNNRRGMPGAN